MNNQGLNNTPISTDAVNLGLGVGMGDVVGMGMGGSTRRTSRVWRYFGMVDNCHYICRLCSFVGAYTNTTNMRKHIQHHHPERFQDILDHTRPTTRPFYSSSLPRMRPPQPYPPPAQSQGYPPSLVYPYTAGPKRMILPKPPEVSFIQVPGSSSSSNEGAMLTSSHSSHSSQASSHQPHYSFPATTFAPLGPPPSSAPFTPPVMSTSTAAPYTTTPPQPATVTACELSPEESKIVNQFFPPVTEATECSSDSDTTTSRGAAAAEERSDYGHNNGEDVQVSLSPEQILSEASEREPTPAPPTPPKPESYQLRHNNHLNIVLEALARDESFMDVTLTAQGRSLKAHKSVLSAVSPYFRGVLRENPCQHPIIIMPRDVRFEELYSIVNYIYKGEMTVAAEDLTSLLKTAEILQVSGLAPSDSTATMNPNIDTPIGGNMRSSSASSSSSSSTHQTGSRAGRVKALTTETPTPPARPKSTDNVINPSDFMDVNMTCVKEEVPSEWDEDEELTNEASNQPSFVEEKKTELTQYEDQSKSMQPDHNADSPMASTSVMKDQMTIDTIKSEPPGPSHSADTTLEDPIPFTCPHCQDIHRGFDVLTSHLRLKHPSKPSFPCGCGRVFVRQMQHQAHARLCSNLT